MKMDQNDYLIITTIAERHSLNCMLLVSQTSLTTLMTFGKATSWKAYTSDHRLLGGIDTANLTKDDFANADTFICRMCSDTHNIMIKPT